MCSGEVAAFAELFCRMLRTALCESGINFRHGHGEVAAFAELFCGMLRPDVLYAVMKVSPIYTPRRYTETRGG